MQALALHKQRSMVPMPSKRTSAVYGQQQQQQQSSHQPQQQRSSRQPRERQMPPNDPQPSGMRLFPIFYTHA